MAIEQQIQQLKGKLKGNIPMVFMAGMALLLLLRLAIYFMESGGSVAPPQSPTVWKPKDNVNPDSVKKVEGIIKPLPEFKESERYPLAERNMFDPQLVVDASDIEKRANTKVEQALEAYYAARQTGKRSDYQKALELVNEALGLQPIHRRGKSLKADIEKALQKVAATPEVTPEATASPEATPSPEADGG